MNRILIVRKAGPSVLVWKPTEEAKRVEEENRKKGSVNALPHDQVHQNAVRVARDKGVVDPSINILLGFYKIQVGKYQGKSFRWLVENDMGYVTCLLCQVEVDGGNTGPGAMNNNKRQLKWYLESFPDGRAALVQRRKELHAKKPPRSSTSPSSQTSSTPTASQETLCQEKNKVRGQDSKTGHAENQTMMGEEMIQEELLTEVETLESRQLSR